MVCLLERDQECVAPAGWSAYVVYVRVCARVCVVDKVLNPAVMFHDAPVPLFNQVPRVAGADLGDLFSLGIIHHTILVGHVPPLPDIPTSLFTQFPRSSLLSNFLTSHTSISTSIRRSQITFSF